MSDQITTLTNDNFESVIKDAQTPVLVDFWAEWCGPCKVIAPVLEELATEYAGRLTIAKLNVDDHREATEKFNIRGIPTLILFKNGEPEATKVGALSKSQLAAFLDSNI
jgi:thioredoxin 1